jgi:hypothetical protein
MIWFVAVTERVNYFIADTHPTLVHRISELLLTRLRPTSHRRVFTRRQPVDRVRPIDVRFQINVHCVSVRAVTTSAKIFVAVIGVTICSFLGWLVAVWLVSESDYRGAAALRLHITGGVLSLIGGILIAIKWIKPIKAFKRFKRDAKRIKPIKRFKK